MSFPNEEGRVERHERVGCAVERPHQATIHERDHQRTRLVIRPVGADEASEVGFRELDRLRRDGLR